ncbi:MAG: hypothetical protein EA401_05795 [Planctomycetota bacterium]|nr:MAG: hypothetical protein EA401_05795 [Planctomycetota bacterium]
MAMRIDLEFAKPLSREQRISLHLALAALPKTARVRVIKGGHAVVVMGEALGVDRVRAALQEEGVQAERIRTSLSDEEDLRADEISEDHPDGRERLRPIGR